MYAEKLKKSHLPKLAHEIDACPVAWGAVEVSGGGMQRHRTAAAGGGCNEDEWRMQWGS